MDLRILQIIPYLNRSLGGDVAVCSSLSMNLAKRGHEVTICTSDRTDQGLEEAMASMQVEVVSLPSSIRFAGMIVTPQMSKWVRSRLNDFDIVHLHGYRTYQNAVTDRYFSRQGTPIVLQCHGSYPRIVERKTAKVVYDLVWGRRISSHCTKVIAVSDIERNQYLSGGIAEGKIEVIPNAVDVDRFITLPEKGRFRTESGFGSGRLILYVGRIHQSKDLNVLLDAFALVRAKGWGCSLAFVGSNSGQKHSLQRRALRLGVSDYVHFVDHTEHPEIAYVDADLVVYPSPHEIFGLVPFEAMMCHTPVIVAHGTGCGEIVGKNGLGYTFSPGNVEELTFRIVQAFLDPEGAHILAARGREYTLRNLHWERVTSMFERTYESCISDQQRPL